MIKATIQLTTMNSNGKDFVVLLCLVRPLAKWRSSINSCSGQFRRPDDDYHQHHVLILVVQVKIKGFYKIRELEIMTNTDHHACYHKYPHQIQSIIMKVIINKNTNSTMPTNRFIINRYKTRIPITITMKVTLMIVNRIKQSPSIMTRDTWHKFQMKEFSPQTSPDPITRPIQFNL